MHRKTNRRTAKHRLLACVAVAAIGAAAARADETPPADWPDVPMNRVQVIGSHNSYKQPIDAALLRLFSTFSAEAGALDYAHAPLEEQLELGLRGIELDLYHDPEGGRYATPLGLRLLKQVGAPFQPFDAGPLAEPGFKVMHVADVDFRSSQPTLRGALEVLRVWSDANPGHLPVVVTMNLKDGKSPVPGGVEPLPFDAAALDALDAVLRAGLGEDKLLTPDMVRGDAATLERAVRTRGWPRLSAVRGRFLFAADEGGAKRRAYTAGRPSLEGRVMFTTAAPGSPDAAVLVMNSPLRSEAAIRRRVAQGYLVRTRADALTREARSGDTRRFEAALRSGAHVISTDYYRPDPRFGAGYRVSFGPSPYTAPPFSSGDAERRYARLAPAEPPPTPGATAGARPQPEEPRP
ncbi:MAG: Ca2+-dependent phosphoinositide-specific phospholipase C [Planctomycetota bacterium]